MILEQITIDVGMSFELCPVRLASLQAQLNTAHGGIGYLEIELTLNVHCFETTVTVRLCGHGLGKDDLDPFGGRERRFLHS